MARKHSHVAPVSRPNPDSRYKPYFLTPCQYFENFRPNLYCQPEKMLMLAVLQDAIDQYREFLSARGVHGRNACREAADWFWSDQSDWPFSYRNICDALGLDPEYLRAGVLHGTGNGVLNATGAGYREPASRQTSQRKH